MRIFARATGLDGLAGRLDAALAPRLSAAARTEAADALAAAAARAGVAVTRQAVGARLRVGSADPAAVARETGTHATPAAPWLAPALAALRRRR
ncbi:hypothetical protein [Aquabacter spiritensis]|uniref:Uncharacterized protein n=1 Tax=Aquabacter spiritensis TaxID=933073 RepID=A0A4R3M478_9HYPH|nr:hypothetical protein [Aquabacter spiritensis]TCT07626.1 hypothetical protein EDC64_101145 [Aquabacter spiritensis]